MDKHPDPSPISVVCEEELRLQSAMDDAQRQAERLVDEARDAASRRVEEAKGRMPRFKQEAGAQRRAEIEAQARALRGAARDEAAELERVARENLPAAAEFIVSLVVPGGQR